MVSRKFEPVTEVTIEIDETKLTKEFFESFSNYIFYVNSVEDILKHLAQMWARGVVDNDTKFIEGFGETKDFGIKFTPSSVVYAAVDYLD